MAKRTAEAGGGLVAATKAAALRNWIADQNAHRQRIDNAEQAGWQAMGIEQQPTQQQSRGDGIIVTGDVYGDAALAALAGKTNMQQTPQATTAQVPAKQSSPVLAAILGAALLAGGAGIGAGVPWALGAFNQTKTETLDDTATAIEAVQVYGTETTDQ